MSVPSSTYSGSSTGGDLIEMAILTAPPPPRSSTSDSDISDSSISTEGTQGTLCTTQNIITLVEEGSHHQPLTVPEVYEAICVADPSQQDPMDYHVGITYINGSMQTCFEATNEAMHISTTRGGDPVRLLYNNGDGLGFWCFGTRCRTTPPLEHPLCQSLLEVWNQFFEHPQNAGREHLVFFYGNGGIYVRVALEVSPHSSHICVVGISPSITIPVPHRAHHYRVTGDWTNIQETRTTTLPYSDGSEGLYSPSLRCPSFAWALRYGERVLGSSGRSEGEESQPQLDERRVALIVNPRSPVMDQLTSWLGTIDMGIETIAEFNPRPQTCNEVMLTMLFSLTKVSSVVQECLLTFLAEGFDLTMCYVVITGYTALTIRYFFLLFTNHPNCRRLLRLPRLFALGAYPLTIVTPLFDHMNLIRRLLGIWTVTPSSLYSTMFIIGAVINGSVVHVECVRNFYPCLRGRIQRFFYRFLSEEGTLRSGLVRIDQTNTRESAINLFDTLYGGIFLPALIIIFNQVVIQIPQSIIHLNNSTNSSIYPEGNLTRTSSNIQGSQALFFGQTLNSMLYLIVFCINVMFLIRLVRQYYRYHRR
ncbi:DUF687 family protein [Candidatus Chlamydia sanziniae]|uniref:Uncharacterized protein n=1 Tax=Candidatus Chlamydia sanziniae TaxID=1806891 RepID=A0A1A9HWN7_9CHLA|nr:DUF687 family protein [Candidatus Chlamydia sanziniae]ANH78851.1 hypothetical protein Cs308_0681 [Candidatus Chlamydia sanziniae]